MATTQDALSTVVNAQNQQKLNTLTGMASGAAETGMRQPASANTANTAAPASTTTIPAVNTVAPMAATSVPNTVAAQAPAATPAPAPAATTTQNRINEINNMYAAQQAARQAELQSGYDIARSDLQAAADAIAPTYQQQANANAVDWERMRRNFLEGANMSGVNTGAGAQAELHMMGQQQRGQNTLRAAQAGAEAEAARQMANLTAQYQANIQKAAAEADYQKAAALLDEYQKGYERDLKNAQVMAEFGDFTGFAGLYGEDAAAAMRNNWLAQNPDLAYMMGLITKQQHTNLKAKRPMNAAATGGGGATYMSGPSYYTPGGGGNSAEDAMAAAVGSLADSVFGTSW